jgi:hypothetical protein
MPATSTAAGLTVIEDRYAWVDANDDGRPVARNIVFEMPTTGPVPSAVYNAPFGHGLTVVDLGPQPQFTRRLQDGLDGRDGGVSVKAVADALAEMIPVDAPRSCLIHLGAQDDPTASALRNDLHARSILLCVWGSDPECDATATAELQAAMSLATERGGVYTIMDLVSSKQLPSCNEYSRVYRIRLAVAVVDRLQQFGIQVTTPVSATNNFDLVHVIPARSGVTTCMIDYNNNDAAAVFHSPEVGCTFYVGTSDGSPLTVPASDGRSINVGRTDDDCDQLVQCHPPAGHYSILQDELTAAASRAPTSGDDSLTATSVQHLVRTNTFAALESTQSFYCPYAGASHLSNVKSCNGVFQLRAIATAVPAAVRANGKLMGVVACDTLSDLLSYTMVSEERVIVENSTTWIQQLIAISPGSRVHTFMNERNEVEVKGIVTHYSIDRAELQAAIQKKQSTTHA